MVDGGAPEGAEVPGIRVIVSVTPQPDGAMPADIHSNVGHLQTVAVLSHAISLITSQMQQAMKMAAAARSAVDVSPEEIRRALGQR